MLKARSQTSRRFGRNSLRLSAGGTPMRLRDFLKATPLMSLALISVLAKPLPPVLDRPDYAEGAMSADPIERRRPALPLPPPLVLEDKVLESVYYNALAILSTNNRCSD